MKSIKSVIKIIFILALVVTITFCGKKQVKNEDGTEPIIEKESVVNDESKTQAKVESPKEVVPEKVAVPSTPELSKEEKEIRQLITRMHNSWQKLIDEKDINEILQYFAPAYITNQVSIYADNSGNIQSYTNKDFPKYLKSVTKRKGYKNEFSKVRFLDVEIKDHTYFNTVYKCQLKETDNKNKTTTSSIIITVTGKRVDNKWKIGNYSWVNFEYN
jgi:hypothetical protein